MVDDKWSPWIQHNGGTCPIPWASWNQYEAKFLDGSVASGWCDALGFAGRKDDWWRHKGRREYCHIVAYRYLLSAAPPGWTPPGSPAPYTPSRNDLAAMQPQPIASSAHKVEEMCARLAAAEVYVRRYMAVLDCQDGSLFADAAAMIRVLAGMKEKTDG